MMARARSNRSLGYRAEQTGLLLAAGNGPLTFQRTLMPRSTTDQALITGLSFATNHAVGEPVTGVAPVGRTLARRVAPAAPRLDERRWSRASLAVDAAAVAAGIGVQTRILVAAPDERLPRAGAPHRLDSASQ